jgi:hypothetical protein
MVAGQLTGVGGVVGAGIIGLKQTLYGCAAPSAKEWIVKLGVPVWPNIPVNVNDVHGRSEPPDGGGAEALVAERPQANPILSGAARVLMPVVLLTDATALFD